MTGADGIRGKVADLYDVFVDWPGRLGREMPGLLARLERATKVLDAGCGTGRHVQALLAEGFDAYGADASEDMLAQARALSGDERFFDWRMGEPPPAALRAKAPFDAIVSLGNTWPQILAEADVQAALAAFKELVRPGGRLVLGMKAVAIRRETKDPYLPLLKREKDGKAVFFIRFVDFDVPPLDDGTDVCAFHMVVVGEDEDVLAHRSGRSRVWSPSALQQSFANAGFEARVSGSIGDPDAPAKTEDVFVHARAPAVL